MTTNNGPGLPSDRFLPDLYEIVSTCFIVGTVIIGSFAFSALVVQLIFPAEIMDEVQTDKVLSIVVLTRVVSFQAAIIGLILALAQLTSSEPLRFIFALAPPRTSLRTIISLFAIITVFQALFSALTSIFFPADVQSDLEIFRDIIENAPLMLSVMALIIGAPLSEELLFRGYLMNRLSRTWLGFGGATIVSTTIWTLLHTGYSTVGLIEVFIAGLLFSWVLWQTGSLWITILFHAIYNGFVFIYLVAMQSQPAM